ncbi:hypothetical protein R4K54_13850, partial [Brachyspira murdochii]
MEKEFASIFEDNKDISLNEYDINKLIERTIKIKENEFPIISIGNTDKDSPKIQGVVTSKEYNKDILEFNNVHAKANSDKSDSLNSAYTDEENKQYKNLEESLSLSENDLESAGNIIDSELDMSSLFQNALNNTEANDDKKDNDNNKEEDLSNEQNYVVDNIYSREENDIHKSAEKEALTEDELNTLETVEDFNLEDSFEKNENPLDEEEEFEDTSDISNIGMKEYTDEELLDINNILDDEEFSSNETLSENSIENPLEET